MRWQHGQHAPAGAVAHSPSDGAARGQVIIMFALCLTGLLGMVGLAIDLGIAFAERRTVQNAADAGAMAGARVVAKWSPTNNVAAQSEVLSVVVAAANRMGNSNQTLQSCDYIANNGVAAGACAAPVPAAATGVRVTVREVHPTYFIRIIPGVPATVTVDASATAQIQNLAPLPSQGIFIVCGFGTTLASGGSFSILRADGTVDPAAYNKTYLVHGPQVAGCGGQANAFKGLALPNSNVGKTINQWWDGDNGTKAGPTRERVNGIEGCNANADDPYNCVMLLPVATNNPAPTGNPSDYRFYIKHILAFWITQSAANKHTGTLLSDYVVVGPGDPTWCRDCGGVTTLRLID